MLKRSAENMRISKMIALVVIIGILLIFLCQKNVTLNQQSQASSSFKFSADQDFDDAATIPKKSGNELTGEREDDWQNSEVLNKFSMLQLGMSRSEVERFLGNPTIVLEDFGCAEVGYVKDPDEFIGRPWVSGGPHSFSGVTVCYIDDKAVFFDLNPGFVDQDRLESYYLEFPPEDRDTRMRRQLSMNSEQLRRKTDAEQDAAPQIRPR